MSCFKGNYINNEWLLPKEKGGEYTRYSPANYQQKTLQLQWGKNDVDQAVSAAQEGFRAWRALTLDTRKEYILRLPELFKKRRDDLAYAISIETGKPLWEAHTEVNALIGKIDIMTEEGLEETATVYPAKLQNGLYLYRPLGVLAVIAPFNFPVHLANGHIIPALLNGNTVIVKPSLYTALSMQIYFECIEEAGFPKGVINLVHGDGKVGQNLVTHRGTAGVLFTGSYKTGVAIRRATVEEPRKLLALEMGGKNTTIVLEDAQLDQTAYEIALAAFLTTGQRCSATSRIAVQKKIADDLIDRLVDIVKRITIGDPIQEDLFMGPLTTEEAYRHFLAIQENDEDGRLSAILRGGKTREDLEGYYVTPGLWRIHEWGRGEHQSEEIFGPDICIYAFKEDRDAIQFANATDYGLAMSIFTRDTERFEKIGLELETGILNLNRSTCGASSRLPFGGIKNSGNYRPSAILAGGYCAYPQSQLHNKAEWNPTTLNEGPLSKLLKS